MTLTIADLRKVYKKYCIKKKITKKKPMNPKKYDDETYKNLAADLKSKLNKL